VLALPDAGGKRFNMVGVIRDEYPIGGAIDAASVSRLDSGTAAQGKPLLLMRAKTWES